MIWKHTVVGLVFEHGGKKMLNRIQQMHVLCCNCNYYGIVNVKQQQWNGIDVGRNRATKTPDLWICTECMEAILSRQK